MIRPSRAEGNTASRKAAPSTRWHPGVALVAAGALLAAAGLWMIYPPAALIAFGAVGVACGLLLDLGRGDR